MTQFPCDVAALEGLRILDLSTLIAAPMASTLLADFGADVVKVELPSAADPLRDLPPHKDGEPLWWKVTNRNKRGITLDIRKPEGSALFRRMLPDFDVLVENFRPGTLERYGFDCNTLHEINPRLIILRVTGFGQTGEDSNRPGFARVAEAYSGFTNLCGDPDRPPLHLGFPIADAVTGLFGALSILIAAYRRQQQEDCPGEVIDLSLFESMFRLLEFLPIEYDQLGVVRQRSGTRSQYAGPSNIYRSRDGKWVSMSASAQRVFVRVAEAIGRPDLVTDERFSTNQARIQHANELDAIIEPWFNERDADELVSYLESRGVAVGVVNTIEDIFRSAHYLSREAIIRVMDNQLGAVAMPGVVPKLEKRPGRVNGVGPRHGQDTESYFRESVNLSSAEIQTLREKQVI